MSPILMELTPDTSGTFTATVVIAGIVIVVAVLFLLILIFQLFGVIAPKINAKVEASEKKRAERKARRAKAKAEKKAVKNGEIVPKEMRTPAPAPAEVSAAPVSAQPVADDGVSGEVVAAISAAIAQFEGKNVVIRSIRKKNVSGRNPWANAANIDNTRPF